jgi:hypothetical protein
MSSQKLSTAEASHLLEWYASYCVTIAEGCGHPRAAKLLRALSVDMAIEAALRRSVLRRLEMRKATQAVRLGRKQEGFGQAPPGMLAWLQSAPKQAARDSAWRDSAWRDSAWRDSA